MSVLWRYAQSAKDTIRFMSRSDRRNLYHAAVGVASLVTSGTYVALHTTLQDKVVSALGMYRYQIPLPVPPAAQKLFDETIADFQLDSSQLDVKLFNFAGSDVYSIGSLALPTGANIGLPYNFHFDNIKQIRRDDLRFLGQYRTKQSLSSPEMKSLYESLIWSPQAKKYVLAHELHHLQSSYLYVKAFNILTFTMASLLVAPNVRSSLKVGNRYVKLGAGLLGSVCVALAGWLADELIDQTYDIRALNQALTAADRREEYAQGAVEYYDKIIQRNQALFKLLKQFGPSFYTEQGEAKTWIAGLFHKSYRSHLELAHIYLKDMQNTKNPKVFRLNYK